MPTCNVATTISVLMVLGKMCTNRMRGVEAPATRARDTKSIFFSCSTSPRNWRAKRGQMNMVSTATMMANDAPPNVTTSTSAISTSGMASRMSTNRIMASSTTPPYQPAISPSSTPILPPTPRVTAAAISEMRAP